MATVTYNGNRVYGSLRSVASGQIKLLIFSDPRNGPRAHENVVFYDYKAEMPPNEKFNEYGLIFDPSRNVFVYFGDKAIYTFTDAGVKVTTT